MLAESSCLALVAWAHVSPGTCAPTTAGPDCWVTQPLLLRCGAYWRDSAKCYFWKQMSSFFFVEAILSKHHITTFHLSSRHFGANHTSRLGKTPFDSQLSFSALLFGTALLSIAIATHAGSPENKFFLSANL